MSKVIITLFILSIPVIVLLLFYIISFTIALLIFSRREKKGREFSLRTG